MLLSLRLTNFRAFRDSGPIPLRRLTFLIGKNSSGKSTILKALSLVKQTVLARDPEVPLVLNGRFVDLGSYHDVVYRHDLKVPIGLELSMRGDDPSRARLGSKETTRVFKI